MRRTNVAWTLVLTWCLLTLVGCVSPPTQPAPPPQPDPLETAVARFEHIARSRPQPEGAVVFVGSSSIARWTTLAEDLKPIPVIRRGMSGSMLSDCARYADRLVQAPRPRAIVLFAGTNDIRPGRAREPEAVLQSFQEFVMKARSVHPRVPIYFIAITPSPSRWTVWPIAQEANEAVRRYIERENNLRYIDLNRRLLDPEGRPDPVYYVEDRLHMSAAGYQIWREVIRDRLLQDFPDLAASASSH